MHVSIIQAGSLLARLCRPEVDNCIKGLQQYSYAYEECMEQATEIQRHYQQALVGESDLNHMASVFPKAGSIPEEPMPLNNGGIEMHFNHAALAGGYRG